MGVHTPYDDKRDMLRDMLNDCLEFAKDMFNEDIWGFDEMREGYIKDVYRAIEKARDEV